MEDKLATKQDILDVKKDIQNLETKLEYSISQVKSELTIRMGTMLAASIAILTAIQKLT